MSKYNIPKTIAPKKEKTRIYNFTRETLEEHDEQVRAATMPDAIYVCNAMYSAAFLLALRDELSFGARRMAKIFARVQSTFNAIMSGHLNYYDIAKQLREECKVNLVIEKPDGLTVQADDIYKAVSGIKSWKVRIR